MSIKDDLEPRSAGDVVQEVLFWVVMVFAVLIGASIFTLPLGLILLANAPH